MLPNVSNINTTDFVSAMATATTTGVLSIPANRYFSLDIQLAGSQSGAGTATPRVTYVNSSTAGTFSPQNGATVAQLSITGLLGIVASAADTVEFAGYSGDAGASFNFNVGGGTASCVINGYLI